MLRTLTVNPSRKNVSFCFVWFVCADNKRSFFVLVKIFTLTHHLMCTEFCFDVCRIARNWPHYNSYMPLCQYLSLDNPLFFPLLVSFVLSHSFIFIVPHKDVFSFCTLSLIFSSSFSFLLFSAWLCSLSMWSHLRHIGFCLFYHLVLLLCKYLFYAIENHFGLSKDFLLCA